MSQRHDSSLRFVIVLQSQQLPRNLGKKYRNSTQCFTASDVAETHRASRESGRPQQQHTDMGEPISYENVQAGCRVGSCGVRLRQRRLRRLDTLNMIVTFTETVVILSHRVYS